MLSWNDFLACRDHGHDHPGPDPGLDVDPGLGFHWFLTLLESVAFVVIPVQTAAESDLVVYIGYNCDHVLECIVCGLEIVAVDEIY